MACSHCDTAGALLSCGGCKEGLQENGQPSQVLYCGQDCLNADRNDHATKCGLRNDRLQLYRGAKLMQNAFFQLHGEFFDIPVASLGRVGDKLIVNQQRCDPQGPIYFEFPNDHVPEDREKKALLSWFACDFNLVQMFNLLCQATEGITVDCFEYRVKVHAHLARFNSGLKHENGSPRADTDIPHSLLQILLKDGTAYAVDACGAQFGQLEPVMLWDRFEAEFVQEHVSKLAMGTERLFHHEIVRNSKRPYDTSGLMVAAEAEKLHADFDQALESWSAQSSLTVRDILHMRTVQHEKHGQQLLVFLRQQTDMLVKLRGHIVQRRAPATTGVTVQGRNGSAKTKIEWEPPAINAKRFQRKVAKAFADGFI